MLLLLAFQTVYACLSSFFMRDMTFSFSFSVTQMSRPLSTHREKLVIRGCCPCVCVNRLLLSVSFLFFFFLSVMIQLSLFLSI